jgi:hypothetical protein
MKIIIMNMKENGLIIISMEKVNFKTLKLNPIMMENGNLVKDMAKVQKN